MICLKGPKKFEEQIIDVWHVTCTMWHVRSEVMWTFSPNFSYLALTVWEEGVLKIWRKRISHLGKPYQTSLFWTSGFLWINLPIDAYLHKCWQGPEISGKIVAKDASVRWSISPSGHANYWCPWWPYLSSAGFPFQSSGGILADFFQVTTNLSKCLTVCVQPLPGPHQSSHW